MERTIGEGHYLAAVACIARFGITDFPLVPDDGVDLILAHFYAAIRVGVEAGIVGILNTGDGRCRLHGGSHVAVRARESVTIKSRTVCKRVLLLRVLRVGEVLFGRLPWLR